MGESKFKAIAKIFVNFIWGFSCLFLLIPFFILFNRYPILSKSSEFQKGDFHLEEVFTYTGNYRGGGTIFKGRVNGKEKWINWKYYKGMITNLDAYPISSTHSVWYHEKIKSAFFNLDNAEKFKFPKSYLNNMYLFIILSVTPFLFFSLLRYLLR